MIFTYTCSFSLCPTINFTFEVFVKNEFHHRNKYIGFARLRVRADQNDRLRVTLLNS